MGLGGLLLLGVCEWMLRTWIVPIHDSRANRVHRVYTASRPDVVLGDSQLYRVFINTERFENLARPGSSPAALEIVAREYFRHGEPGRVIVQASPQLFTRQMQNRGAQEHDRWFGLNVGLPFAPYVFEPGICGEMGAFLDWPALEKRAAQARGRRKVDGSLVEREAARRRARSAGELDGEARKRARQTRPVPDVKQSPAFAAYERLLDSLIDQGAQVCLVQTPGSKEYEAAVATDPLHQQAYRAMRDAARSRELPYLAARDLGVRYRVDDFTNPDHLTTRAGGEFALAVEAACYPGPAVPSSSSTR